MSRMFHDQIGRQANEFLGNFYDGYRRGGQTQARGQSGAKQFVDQNAAVLGVILELDHIIVTVAATHQVGLRAAAHAPYLLECPGHGG